MSTTRIGQLIRRERGQTATELALVLPILMLILLAILQFGLVFRDYLTLTDAVRSGTRKAAVARHLPNPEAYTIAEVKKAADDLQNEPSVTVESTWQSGHDVVVSASYPYSINLLGMVVKSGDLKSTTTERVE